MESNQGESLTHKFITKIWEVVKFFLKYGSLATGIVIAYFPLNDYWTKQTRLKVYPSYIQVDSTLIYNTPFELTNSELVATLKIEQIDGEDYWGASNAALQMEAMYGRNSKTSQTFNVRLFDFARIVLDKKQTIDSIKLEQTQKSGEVYKTIKENMQARDSLRNIFRATRNKYYDLYQNQQRLLIVLNIANNGATRTALMEPVILRLMSDPPIDIRMSVTGSESTMEMLGISVNVGRATTLIDSKSTELIAFASKTSKDMGSDWTVLLNALRSSNYNAKILFEALDGTIIESDEFPFSLDFANNSATKRFERLKKLR